MRTTLDSMDIRLRTSQLDFYVDVHLRNFEGRWLAVAEIADEPEIGLGRTARDALVGALSSLGAASTAALLADPRLSGVNRLVER